MDVTVTEIGADGSIRRRPAGTATHKDLADLVKRAALEFPSPLCPGAG